MIWPFKKPAPVPPEPDPVDNVAEEAARQRRSASAQFRQLMTEIGKDAEEIATAIGDSLGSKKQ